MCDRKMGMKYYEKKERRMGIGNDKLILVRQTEGVDTI